MLIHDTIEYNDETREQIPLRRFGKPDEIAAVIEFLAGPGGSFMVGQIVSRTGARRSSHKKVTVMGVRTRISEEAT